MRRFARHDEPVVPMGQDAPRGRIHGTDGGRVAVPAYPSAKLASVRVHRAATDTWEDVPLAPTPSLWARITSWVGGR